MFVQTEQCTKNVSDVHARARVCVCVVHSSLYTILVKHIWVARSGDFLGELQPTKGLQQECNTGCGFWQADLVCVCEEPGGVY